MSSSAQPGFRAPFNTYLNRKNQLCAWIQEEEIILGKIHYFRAFSPPPPNDLPELLHASMREANRALRNPPQETSRPNIRLLNNRFREALREKGIQKPTSPWHRYCECAFWFSAARTFPAWKWKFGALTQRCLTGVLLDVRDEDRERISRFRYDVSHADWMDWTAQYIGALSTARVAAALNRMRIPVVIPTSQIDGRYKIDLMGLLPDERLLCIQVKTGSNGFLSTSDHVAHDEAPESEDLNHPISLRTRERIWQGMNDFRESGEIPTVSGIVHVPFNQESFSLESSRSSLLGALSSLISR